MPRSGSAASSRRVRGGRTASQPYRARLLPPPRISTNSTSFEPLRDNPTDSSWKAPATRIGQGRRAEEAEAGSAGAMPPGAETRRRTGASLDGGEGGATLRRVGGKNPNTPGQGTVEGCSSGLGPGFGSATPGHGRCDPSGEVVRIGDFALSFRVAPTRVTARWDSPSPKVQTPAEIQHGGRRSTRPFFIRDQRTEYQEEP